MEHETRQLARAAKAPGYDLGVTLTPYGAQGFGWSAVETRNALTYDAVWVSALAAYQAGRPDLIRSPRVVLAHVWEGWSFDTLPRYIREVFRAHVWQSAT